MTKTKDERIDASYLQGLLFVRSAYTKRQRTTRRGIETVYPAVVFTGFSGNGTSRNVTCVLDAVTLAQLVNELLEAAGREGEPYLHELRLRNISPA